VSREQEPEIVDLLVGEFNDELQAGKVPSYEPYLQRCPPADRTELTSLLNTLVLADRALAPLRELLQDPLEPEQEPEKCEALEAVAVYDGD
jgi:hypothetical protein